MTKLQFEHHMEEFDAYRRDFEDLWRPRERQLERDFGFSKQQLYAAQQVAWRIFIHAMKRGVE